MINGSTTEHGNLSAILSEHAREIQRQVNTCFRSNTNRRRLCDPKKDRPEQRIPERRYD